MTKAKKIFVGNYKGGVGKTTSIYQIARHIANNDKKVLLIDLDPQCSLSEICIDNRKSLYELPQSECLNYVYDMWIKLKSYPINEDEQENNLFYIPSNIFYNGGGLDEIAMKMNNDLEDLPVLQQFMQKHEIEEEYDYILFDCPPSNNVITQGAFLFSDYYIIPTILQTMSVRGIAHYVKTVENIYKRYCEKHKDADIARLLFGEKPKLLGIFQTLKKSQSKNDKVVDELNAIMENSNIRTVLEAKGKGPYLFSSIIKNYEDIARDTAQGKITDVYKDLTNEIIECID
jgi:chromosome partitioning protein